MKSWKQTSSLLLTFVVATLTLLLILLATLQYRWLGQVNESGLKQRRVSLHAQATQFSLDFDREVSRAFFHFQMSMSTSRGTSLNEPDRDYVDRYREWLTKSPYPQLVSDVFRVRANEQRQIVLEQLNYNESRLVPVEWPAEFVNLRQKFERDHKSITSGKEMFLRSSIKPIDEEIPALVIALPAIQISTQTNEVKITDYSSSFVFTIVALDLNFVRQELIPSLARRYFSGETGLDFDLTIVNRNVAHETVFHSGLHSSGEALASGDAAVNLFAIRHDEFNYLMGDQSSDIESSSKNEPASPGPVSLSVAKTQGGTNNSASAPVNEQDGIWRLVVRHRAGSLDAAVASVHHRNLFISFSVLLLLGASIWLIIISVRRAERLANHQMQFVAGVSHELRTPLAVICSAGENLVDGVVTDGQQTRRYGKLILNEGRRLTEMVEQILEFSSQRSGQKTYAFRPVKIDGIIKHVLAICETQLTEGGVHVEQDIAPDLPPMLADASALKRALQNLLSNAIKYGGEAKWIKISAHLSANGRESEVRLSVEDKGLGIDAGELAHIFEPFRRGREAVAAQVHGNGLGLSLVQYIAEAHGGRVTVKSELKSGSRFTIHIPVTPAKVEAGAGISIPENYESANTAHRG